MEAPREVGFFLATFVPVALAALAIFALGRRFGIVGSETSGIFQAQPLARRKALGGRQCGAAFAGIGRLLGQYQQLVQPAAFVRGNVLCHRHDDRQGGRSVPGKLTLDR